MAAKGMTMLKSMILLGAAAGLATCGQAADEPANNAAANTTAAAKPDKTPYCFFKDSEMKGWKAAVGKGGNVVVTGKAYRSDSRYIAQISAMEVSGSTATVRPTINPNTTGYGAPDNWWDISQAIPDSAEVTTVMVKCGAKTVATLDVPRKGARKAG
jgi:hypothetical protein